MTLETRNFSMILAFTLRFTRSDTPLLQTSGSISFLMPLMDLKKFQDHCLDKTYLIPKDPYSRLYGQPREISMWELLHCVKKKIILTTVLLF